MFNVKDVVKGCCRGKRESQYALYEHFAPKMLVLCFRYCDSQEEAEDVLQDGFILVFENIRSYKGKGSLEGWIRKIMVNTALNYLKKISKFRYHEAVDTLPDSSQPSVEPSVKMETRELLEMIRSLPPGYRLVFNLFEVEGYSHREIAEMLEISENTSKSQLMRAKKKLQEKIGHYSI